MEKKEETEVSSTPRISVKASFLERFPGFLETYQGGGMATRKKYVRIIRAMIGRKKDLTQDHITNFITSKKRRYVASAVKLFLKHVSREGGISREDLNIILEDLPKVREEETRPRTIPTIEEFNRVMDGLNDENRMVLRFLIKTGLRCHEVFKIRMKDIDFTGRNVSVPTMVKTKGGKIRPVKIPAEFLDELRKYLAEEKGLLGEELIFYTRSSGTPETKAKYFWRVLNKTSNRVLGRGIQTHDPRRFFGSYLLEKTGDVELVNRVMGHKSINTTLKYTQYAKRDSDLKKVEELMDQV